MEYTSTQLKVAKAIIDNVCKRRIETDKAFIGKFPNVRKIRKQKQILRQQHKIALEYMGINVSEPKLRLSQDKQVSYQEYLQSPEWKIRADDAKARAGYRCQLCNSEQNLHTHHRTYERLGEELPGDLTVLCADCHSKFHKVGDYGK